jgi:hypothetical protein
LEVSDQAEAILAAGRLTEPTGDDPDSGGLGEGSPHIGLDAGLRRSGAMDGDIRLGKRYPNIAVAAGGTILLVYLARRPGEKTARLRSVDLRFDAETGRPRLESGDGAVRTVGEGLATAPFLVSADGRRVFGLTGGGQVATFPLTAQPP